MSKEILCIDCRIGSSLVTERKFGAVIATPPYNLASGQRTKLGTRYEGIGDSKSSGDPPEDEYFDPKMDQDSYSGMIVEQLLLVSKTVQEGGCIILQHKKRQINGTEWHPLCEIVKPFLRKCDANFRLQKTIDFVTRRTNACNGKGTMQDVAETFFVLRLGNPYLDRKAVRSGEPYHLQSNLWTLGHPMINGNDDDRKYATPFLAARSILNLFTRPNDSILDLYAGFGTFLVASQERDYLGFEIMPKKCNMAAEWITNNFPTMIANENSKGHYIIRETKEVFGE